ncbi:MAG: hypothetical protein NVS9B14_24560 [Candidatus Acidiferrum sp.]
MSAKKKTSKKQMKPKRTARKKMAPVKKKAVKRKSANKKLAVKSKGVARKTIVRKAAAAPKKPIRGKSQSVNTVAFVPEGLGARSGGQSGDLQGLSNREGADSESVDELLEEGNAFEAEVVKGVEDAGDADESEVHTHEVPEDDVPGEYLDKE